MVVSVDSVVVESGFDNTSVGLVSMRKGCVMLCQV